jgi:cytochrome c oxidase subunit 2
MQEQPGSRRHLVWATIVWVVLAAIGIGIMFALSPFLISRGAALPPPASQRADDINRVLGMFTLLAIPVFAMVVAYAGYSIWHFRSRGRPYGFGAPIRGNIGLQVSWLVISLALVAFLWGYGFYFLNQVNASPQGDVLHVDVIGEQWLWNYIYPSTAPNGQLQPSCPTDQNPQAVQSTELYIPVNRPVTFDITACDVQHSFWVPSLGIKEDAVPGEINHITVTPDKIGDFVVRCAELCGLYHAYMNTPVHVVSESDFNTWLTTQQQQIPSTPSSSSAIPHTAPVAAAADRNVWRPTAWREG